MANWIPEKITQSCGHVEVVKIPHPEFDGEQINPDKWRRQVATVPCHECFKHEQEKNP